MLAFLRVLVFLLAAGSVASGRGMFPDLPLVRRANAWKPGQPIPRELLRYRDTLLDRAPPSGGTGSHDADTIGVFLSIENYELFRQIAFTPCDDRVFALAVGQALVVGGPNRFYGDVDAKGREHPAWLAQKRFARLAAQGKRRQVVVQQLFADDQDMSPAQAKAVFERTAAELRAGGGFGPVAEKCQAANPAANGWQSLVAVEAEPKILAEPAGGDPGGAPDLPAPLRPLLDAHAGEVFVLHDDKARQTRLYFVKEVYPAQENKTTSR